MSATGVAVLLALALGILALAVVVRPRRGTAIDYYLAGQRVGVLTNAWAICGDYFSAASFLGVAAAVYASGLDGAWYAAGFAAGFLPVLLFIAAPLRRFGEFSIPDFLGRRFDSEAVRLVAVGVVLLVILAYLIPQSVGTGLTWELLVDAALPGLSPYATGVVLSTVVITALVSLGGMRGTTWTQAVQFLFLVAALVWLTAVAVERGFTYPAALAHLADEPLRTAVQGVDGQMTTEPVVNALHGGPSMFNEPGSRYDGVGQFALVVTLMLGTAGLPHILNRFFTSPTGRAARRTGVWVLAFAGLFYALAVMLGTAARDLIPRAAATTPWLEEYTVDGILEVPEHVLLVLGRLFAGTLGLGVISVGALMAVMSTIAGLLLAAAVSAGHDVYERHINPDATHRQAVWAGRVTVVVTSLLSAGLALGLGTDELTIRFPSLVAQMVTWAFALAGSALTPVLVLAIWWPRTTAAGAVAGMTSGVVVALALMAVGVGVGADSRGLAGFLLVPSAVAATCNLVVTVGVSRRTKAPVTTGANWVRMHGTAADRRAERLARLTLRGL